FPVERIVGEARRHVGAQLARAKQRGAAARAKMRGYGMRGRGMEEMDAVAIDIPVGEARFLTTAVRAALVNLRRDRKHVGRAMAHELGDALGLDTHVVV